jgi:hypothetical protein
MCSEGRRALDKASNKNSELSLGLLTVGIGELPESKKFGRRKNQLGKGSSYFGHLQTKAS